MLLLITFFTSLSWSGPLAVYGEDNRHEVFEEKNLLIKNSALSTAAMIDNFNLKEGNGFYSISGKTLGQMFNLCSGEKFSYQPFAANCSGTLVAQDIIMTAGHCYDYAKETCADYSWVFDYRVSKDRQPVVRVRADSVYRCKDILHVENDKSGVDYALIRLDREVSGRLPVKLQGTPVKPNDDLVLIGHPSGLPTKIADDGKVLKIERNHYVANVDAFTINSGSGVFNPKTGDVVGVLSSGRRDYQETKDGCSKPIVYKMEEGNEAVFKLDKIIKLLKEEL